MKQIILSIFLFVLFSFSVQAQSVKRNYKTFTETTYNAGDLMLAPQIWFGVNSCEVLPESADSVKVIADFLSKHPGFVIEIGVHTEMKEDAVEENLKFSKCQAKAIMRYLVKEFQVTKGSVEAKGYGDQEPVVDEELIRTSPLHRDYLNQKNKRIELKILLVK